MEGWAPAQAPAAATHFRLLSFEHALRSPSSSDATTHAVGTRKPALCGRKHTKVTTKAGSSRLTGVVFHTARYTRPKLPSPIICSNWMASQRTAHCRTSSGREE